MIRSFASWSLSTMTRTGRTLRARMLSAGCELDTYDPRMSSSPPGSKLRYCEFRPMSRGAVRHRPKTRPATSVVKRTLGWCACSHRVARGLSLVPVAAAEPDEPGRDDPLPLDEPVGRSEEEGDLVVAAGPDRLHQPAADPKLLDQRRRHFRERGRDQDGVVRRGARHTLRAVADEDRKSVV